MVCTRKMENMRINFVVAIAYDNILYGVYAIDFPILLVVSVFVHTREFRAQPVAYLQYIYLYIFIRLLDHIILLIHIMEKRCSVSTPTNNGWRERQAREYTRTWLRLFICVHSCLMITSTVVLEHASRLLRIRIFARLLEIFVYYIYISRYHVYYSRHLIYNNHQSFGSNIEINAMMFCLVELKYGLYTNIWRQLSVFRHIRVYKNRMEEGKASRCTFDCLLPVWLWLGCFWLMDFMCIFCHTSSPSISPSHLRCSSASKNIEMSQERKKTLTKMALNKYIYEDNRLAYI